jgi:hypothetical protein
MARVSKAPREPSGFVNCRCRASAAARLVAQGEEQSIAIHDSFTPPRLPARTAAQNGAGRRNVKSVSPAGIKP